MHHPRHPHNQMRAATSFTQQSSFTRALVESGQRRYLLVILLLGLESGLGDTVQITLAGLCDAAATLVLIDLYDTDLGEGLEDLAVDGAGGVDVVAGAGAAVLGGTMRISILVVVVEEARGVRTRGPCGDGQHRRSCACRRGGRRRRRGRRTSRCPGGAARWSLFSVLAKLYLRRVCLQRKRLTRCLDGINPTCR
jgi:hypothetical protein